MLYYFKFKWGSMKKLRIYFDNLKKLMISLLIKLKEDDFFRNIVAVSLTIIVFFIVRGIIIEKQEFNEDVKVNIKTCFGNNIIKKDVSLEDYLVGVLYAEENPSMTTNIEYLKAFVIFARTYSLKRGGYKNIESNLSIKSCSSDQNWCDYETGCYREQTNEMFNQCIDFSLSKNSKKPYYSAKKCANRVTTFAGTKKVTNKTFTVTNSAWPKNYAAVAKSTANVSVWKKKASDSYQEYLKKIVKETEGLVIKDENGKIVTIGYMICNSSSSGHIMCMNKAKELGNKGYTALEIIKSYTKDYKNIIIEDYKKNI